MAHWQLGDKDKASDCYNRAVAWMDRRRPHDAEMNLLRDEARTLLGINAPQSQQDKTSTETKGAWRRGREIRNWTSAADEAQGVPALTRHLPLANSC
jgi:hypothetical protein